MRQSCPARWKITYLTIADKSNTSTSRSIRSLGLTGKAIGRRPLVASQMTRHSISFIGGEKVTIRYNPAKPEEYYFPELLRGHLRHFLLQLATVVFFLGVILIGVFLFGRAYK